MDHEKVALSVYDNDELRGRLFDEAYEIFPEFNNEQAEEAADYIFDRMVSELPDGLSDDDREKVEEFLYEHIYAGLT